MPKVKTYIRGDYKQKDGTCAIYCSFYVNSQNVRIPTKVSVLPANFDESIGRVKGTSREAKDANLIIQDIRACINDVFVRFRRKMTKALFPEVLKPQSTMGFLGFLAIPKIFQKSLKKI